MNFLEAATKEQIKKFEEENVIQLPSKYRDWLLYSDGGEFLLPAGVQMYGNVINLTSNDSVAGCLPSDFLLT